MDGPVVLRPVREDDCLLVFKWANDPVTRATSFHPEPIPLDRHRRWFAEAFAGGRRHLRIAEVSGVAVGFLRLDRMEEHGSAEIGISIPPEHRGRKLSVPMLEAAKDEAARLGFRTVVARIRPTNAVSRHIFEKTGFTLRGSETVAGADARRYEISIAPRDRTS
jgi:RimJ/RimL family protein N-acetyltransferase